MERDGYTIIPDFMDAACLAEVRRVLGYYLGAHSGRNDFEGFATERVYTLVARGRVFWDIVLDPRVLALCERFLLPNFLLTASQAICIRPGEKAQAFHHDDPFYTVPRPRPMISFSTIAAVDPFTEENGATEVIPGSHLWGDDWRAHIADAKQVKKFRLIEQKLTAEDEELTPTMKLKRKLVNEKYKSLIESMYVREAA